MYIYLEMKSLHHPVFFVSLPVSLALIWLVEDHDHFLEKSVHCCLVTHQQFIESS